MQPSDEFLAARAARLGEEAAFETLMRRHEARIYQQLRRFTRDAGVAEELCQETFLRAWHKLASFDGRGAFGAWLARLAYNVFLQHLRRQRRRQADTSLDDPQQHGTEAALAGPALPEEMPDLERLLAVVSPDEQRLLILGYAAGLSASEIADMLGTAPGTVKSQIHRAKQKIRRHFGIAAPR